MFRQFLIAGTSACALLYSATLAQADGGNSDGEREVLQLTVAAHQGTAQLGGDPKGAHARETTHTSHGTSGGIEKQIASVVTGCFPGSLRAVLADVSAHFGGRPVIVTSGHRHGGRRGSYHRKCMAADIQIAGVSPGAIARYARSHPSVGGVGTYGHTRSVHVDVGGRVYSWYGNSRRKRYAQAGYGAAGRAS
ncbi:MAG: YcbK family protein [Beijerinckiaceae bacterium]